MFVCVCVCVYVCACVFVCGLDCLHDTPYMDIMQHVQQSATYAVEHFILSDNLLIKQYPGARSIITYAQQIKIYDQHLF